MRAQYLPHEVISMLNHKVFARVFDLTIESTSRDNSPRLQPRVLSRDECQQLLTVCRVNKGQCCIVPIHDTTSETLNALSRPQGTQGSASAGNDIPYRHLFPRSAPAKRRASSPIRIFVPAPQTIRNIVKQIAGKAGLEKLSFLNLQHTIRSAFSKADVFHADIPSSAYS